MKQVEFFSPRGEDATLRRYIEALVQDRFFTIEFLKSRWFQACPQWPSWCQKAS